MSFSMSRRLTKALVMKTTALAALWLLGRCALAGPVPPRIVTLTPHATEMVFAAGGGDHVVATVNSSDYPVVAAALPKVGNGLTSSVEEILIHRPDWVVGWPSPLTRHLESLGVRVWVSDPQNLQDIGNEVQAMADTFGDPTKAAEWLTAYRTELDQLGKQAPGDEPVRALVLASADARYAIGRHGLINDALHQCGMRNVFDKAQVPAPQITQESLLAAKPDVIISTEPLLSEAMVSAPVFVVHADWLYRPGPRFIRAVASLCDIAKQVRRPDKKQFTP